MIINDDCLRGLCGMTLQEDSWADSIVTDPPYGLKFMGKEWDHGIPGEPFWREALRIVKPGAHLLAFGGTRTFHRLMLAIEDAGWEIRDTIMWVYGHGFPKSLNVSKAIDKAAGAKREEIDVTAPASLEAKQWDGWGTALKPAWEPIIIARKSLEGTVVANMLKHGTGGLNIDGCRIPTEDGYLDNVVTPGLNTTQTSCVISRERATVKPAPNGRFPANLIHDGSEEVLTLFPQTSSGKQAPGGHVRNSDKTRHVFGSFRGRRCEGDVLYGDSGSAARFFYSAKASKSDRNLGLPPGEDNRHPTVKPTSLMRYLVRLVTPPEGTVIDPFAGSGSTGVACALEGLNFLGWERDEETARVAALRLRGARELRYANTHREEKGCSRRPI